MRSLFYFQAQGNEQLKYLQLESNMFTAGNFSFSISRAVRALDIANDRHCIELFCSFKLILVIHVFFGPFHVEQNHKITFIDCWIPKDIWNIRLVRAWYTMAPLHLRNMHECICKWLSAGTEELSAFFLAQWNEHLPSRVRFRLSALQGKLSYITNVTIRGLKPNSSSTH